MFYRGRRLRKNETIRSMMKETHLCVDDFIYPIFVVEGENICHEISSLPGVYHYSIDRLHEVIEDMKSCGVRSCILFGIPEHKDCCGSEAYNDDGIVQRAIRKIKDIDASVYVIGDVCMCEYTDHGHCGILDEDGSVNNDKTLEYLNMNEASNLIINALTSFAKFGSLNVFKIYSILSTASLTK